MRRGGRNRRRGTTASAAEPMCEQAGTRLSHCGNTHTAHCTGGARQDAPRRSIPPRAPHAAQHAGSAACAWGGQAHFRRNTLWSFRYPSPCLPTAHTCQYQYRVPVPGHWHKYQGGSASGASGPGPRTKRSSPGRVVQWQCGGTVAGRAGLCQLPTQRWLRSECRRGRCVWRAVRTSVVPPARCHRTTKDVYP